MNRQSSWGIAAVVTVIAAVGFSTQSGRQAEQGPSSGRQSAENHISSKYSGKTNTEEERACSDIFDLFRDFLVTDPVPVPNGCDGLGGTSADKADWQRKTSHLKFIVAILPDPLHTHFPLLFDRVAVAIQEGAQDEKYVYDSFWLPWETRQPDTVLLSDRDRLSDRIKLIEDQPGILLFRREARSTDLASNPPDDKSKTDSSQPYREGLVVFVVGEEPTRGIHRNQFKNAAAWMAALNGKRASPVAVLGPTFSGSLPSLAELLADHKIHGDVKTALGNAAKLQIYSGSTTDKDSVDRFISVSQSTAELKDLHISFHSFLDSDADQLDRFCKYLIQPKINISLKNVAILSEDNTAYGYFSIGNTKFDEVNGGNPHQDYCPDATRLYYPRDISGLRGAYQSQSIFSYAAPQPSGNTSRTTLSTDLADPSGEQHDTLRTYAGDQTTLSQEAELLGIVRVLKAKQTQYIILRSSNSLDQIFLANFLRRNYPSGRLVIVGADLLFQRERGPTGLSGVMTLSTYPLIPWEQDWTGYRSQSHRVFADYTAEAIYTATRLLVGSQAFVVADDPDNKADCSVVDNEHKFVPPAFCNSTPLPDYALPFWSVPLNGEGKPDPGFDRPPVWLSVAGRSEFWPVVVFLPKSFPVDASPHAPKTPDSGLNLYGLTLTMKLASLALVALCLFHIGCCWKASFTAKPNFRAHFASNFSWRHPVLICAGGFQVAMAALIMGWGSGSLVVWDGPIAYSSHARELLVTIIFVSGVSILANKYRLRRLHNNGKHEERQNDWLKSLLLCSMLFSLIAVSWIMFISLEGLVPAAQHPLLHWRAMNLGSGVSPIVPLLCLTLGLYIWFWHSLHGLALFGPDRSRLPSGSDLTIKDENNVDLHLLRMFSHEDVAMPLEKVAMPLATRTLIVVLLLLLTFPILVWATSHRVPIRTLNLERYALIFCLWLDVCFSLLLAEVLQLWQAWCKLRQLLAFLDRTPLRRTMDALEGFSWGNVWKMSGNVLEVRYRVLSRQLETLNHLIQNFSEYIRAKKMGDLQYQDMLKSLKGLRICGRVFAKWYSEHYSEANAGSPQTLETFQENIAAVVGKLWVRVLLPEWTTEKVSLMLTPGSQKDDHSDAGPNVSLASIEPHILNAEELICLTYLGFIQNMLGRMRTMVMSILWLFIAVTVSVSSYPFDPRQTISSSLIALFVVLGGVMTLVYAEIHRDATLSLVTGKNPGELGAEFWFKLIGLGIGPLIGLLATVFPEISDLLFSWFQPSLSAFK